MALTITWSLTAGGAAVTDVTDASVAAGSTTTETEIFLRHNGINPITNAKFFISSYSGATSPAAELAELLEWGDAVPVADYGGFQLNMNAVGTYPVGDWPVYNDKQRAASATFLTGTGDSIANGILLPTTMGAGVTSNGVVIAGTAPAVAFKSRVQVPTNEGTPGKRQFIQKLSFTYTS